MRADIEDALRARQVMIAGTNERRMLVEESEVALVLKVLAYSMHNLEFYEQNKDEIDALYDRCSEFLAYRRAK